MQAGDKKMRTTDDIDEYEQDMTTDKDSENIELKGGRASKMKELDLVNKEIEKFLRENENYWGSYNLLTNFLLKLILVEIKKKK